MTFESKKRTYFINLLRKKDGNPAKMRINGRTVELCDINKQEKLLKYYLDHFLQNCKICGVDFQKAMENIFSDVVADYQKTQKRYGQVLG
jgi:hypothetical protein